MHADLVEWWIRTAALLILPIAPHFSEHIWTAVLKEPKSVQHALWPAPTVTVDQSILDSAVYMRGTIKTMRDAELSLLKKMNKGKQGQATYDPKKPRAVRIYVTHAFPESRAPHPARAHQGQARDAVCAGVPYDAQKRMTQFGTHTALNRTVPFSEVKVLHEILPYLKRTLNLADAEVLSVEEAKSKDLSVLTKALVESAEPGNPAFEYYNV